VSSLGCHLETCAQAVDFKLLRLEPEAALAPCRRCERRPALFDPLMVRKNRVIEAPSNFSDERAELLNN
jgi:hypothetical protein